MKKLLSIAMIAVMLASNATFAYAGNPETVTISITITHDLSIEIGGSADLAISPGSTAVSGSSITVKNNSTGIPETITLSASVPADWTLYFQFASDRPATDDPGWKAAADISELIVYNETKNLWVKLAAPASTDKTSLNIDVTVTATAE